MNLLGDSVKNFIFVLAILIPTITNAQAVRENGLYAVLSTGPTSVKSTSGNSSGDEFKSNGFQFGLGYDFNKYLALEATYGSIMRLESKSAGEKFTLDMTNVSVIVYAPLGDIAPYIKGGIAAVKQASEPSISLYTYGAGVEFKLDQRTNLRLEYLATQKKDGTELNFFHGGIAVRF
jgi:opacity protein-like surface antigen